MALNVGAVESGLAIMTREQLERHQAWCYLIAVAAGLIAGTLWPDGGHIIEAVVWPVLALLLYATFVQMPLTSIPQAFRDRRFLSAALVGNFVLIPAIVWGLVQLTPDDEALRLGLFLVLLVPCTDWFITFTQLGRGDATRATVLTPISLVLQLLLLPGYLWLMTGTDFSTVFAPADVWPAFIVVLAPLAMAALSQVWLPERNPRSVRFRERLAWWPVPLLSVVIFLVAAANVGAVGGALHVLPIVLGIAVAFLGASLLLAKVLAIVAKLSVEAGRTLAFSLGTRNSFIVLPFALSLPAGWEVAAIVVVMQSLVELLGMIFYLWFVPGVLFPSPASRSDAEANTASPLQ